MGGRDPKTPLNIITRMISFALGVEVGYHRRIKEVLMGPRRLLRHQELLDALDRMVRLCDACLYDTHFLSSNAREVHEHARKLCRRAGVPAPEDEREIGAGI